MDAELLNAGAKVAQKPKPSLSSTPLLIDGNEDHNKLTLPFWTYMYLLFICIHIFVIQFMHLTLAVQLFWLADAVDVY